MNAAPPYAWQAFGSAGAAAAADVWSVERRDDPKVTELLDGEANLFESRKAVLAGRTAGLVLDPAYTGKALAGLKANLAGDLLAVEVAADAAAGVRIVDAAVPGRSEYGKTCTCETGALGRLETRVAGVRAPAVPGCGWGA